MLSYECTTDFNADTRARASYSPQTSVVNTAKNAIMPYYAKIQQSCVVWQRDLTRKKKIVFAKNFPDAL